MTAGPTVAIDGPAGAGKSTVSRAVAEALGVDRLDTGAMYRAVAWAALQRQVDLGDDGALAELAKSIRIDVGDRVVVDGTDVTKAIRQPDVNHAVSMVASNAAVRAVLVRRQRQWVVEHGGGVVEGRDIGSVVFPHAAVKVYLTASREERAPRRSEEGANVDVATFGLTGWLGATPSTAPGRRPHCRSPMALTWSIPPVAR